MKKKLIKYNNEELQQKKEVKKQLTELERKKARIKKAKLRIKAESNKACLMEKGIMKKEVENIIGLPLTVDDTNRYGIYCNSEQYRPHRAECGMWYYGNVELVFGRNGILKNKYGCK